MAQYAVTRSGDLIRLAKEDEVLRPAFYGGIAFICALCGFGLVVLAPLIHFPPLQLAGALLVICGIAGGWVALIWGWFRAFRRKRK